jgi:hypothetical protein
MTPRKRQQEQPRGDVHDVMPAIDLEDDEVLTIECATVPADGGVELRLGEEAEEADEDERLRR